MARNSVNRINLLLLLYTLAFWFSKELARPSIAIALADQAMSSSLIGLLLSLQNFLPFLLSIPLASLGDRFGQDKILHLGSFLTLFSALGFLLSSLPFVSAGPEILLITSAQIVSGVSWTVAWIALQALMAELDQARGEKEKGIKEIILLMSIGMVMGPLLAGLLIDWLGLASVWLCNLFLSLLQGVFSFSLLKELPVLRRRNPGLSALKPKDTAKAPLGPRLFDQLGGPIYLVMIVFSFIMMFGSEIKSGYMSVVLRDDGLDSRTIGYIVSAGSLATCLVRIVMNLKIFSKVPRNLLIYVSMASILGAFIGLSLMPAGNSYLIPSLLIGLCGGLLEPVLITYILENTAPNRKGLALTGRVIMNRLAMFVAPVAAGFALDRLGLHWGFASLSLGLGIVIFLNLLGLFKTTHKGGINNGC